MKETIVKIHIERDYSYVEFDAAIDLDTGAGLPDKETLSDIWNKLPPKDDFVRAPGEAKNSTPPPRREPPATAAQRRLLEKAGEWKEGISKAEATTILTKLGY